MEELIGKLTKEFKDSIPYEEQKEQLTIRFKDVLKDTVKSFKDDSYEESELQNIIIRISKKWTGLEFEEKQRRLFVDTNFGSIMEISQKAYDTAISVLLGNDVDIDFEISEEIEKLEELLKEVTPYNKEEAKRLVSEGILDLKFIENSNTDIVSLRLGHIKSNRKGEER